MTSQAPRSLEQCPLKTPSPQSALAPRQRCAKSANPSSRSRGPAVAFPKPSPFPSRRLSQAVAEVRRVAEKGCHAVTFSENPTHLGHPSIHSGHWEPFFAACEELGTVVCVHIGSSSRMVITADDAPMDVMITLTPVNLVQAAADFVWSDVPKRFPALKYALSEGGIGWIPYFRERIDYTYSDSTWPQSPEQFMKQMQAAECSGADIDKISHENAMRLFQYDPFSALGGKENCTVGALRRRAEGLAGSGNRRRNSLATGLVCELVFG